MFLPLDQHLSALVSSHLKKSGSAPAWAILAIKFRKIKPIFLTVYIYRHLFTGLDNSK